MKSSKRILGRPVVQIAGTFLSPAVVVALPALGERPTTIFSTDFTALDGWTPESSGVGWWQAGDTSAQPGPYAFELPPAG